ncbi:MAG: hypothetical protein KDG89_06670, partial [Geminicoccaceae bacterium]|nr:hypothetical protein [Geminicoccaceae bacterium]
LVVVDEASGLPPAAALGALARGRLAVVAGAAGETPPLEAPPLDLFGLARRALPVRGGAGAPAPGLSDLEGFLRPLLAAEGLDLAALPDGPGLAVRHPDRPGRFLLGLVPDGPLWHGEPAARERERRWDERFEALGWRLWRVWSLAWFSDPKAESSRLLEEVARLRALDRDAAAGGCRAAGPLRENPPFEDGPALASGAGGSPE